MRCLQNITVTAQAKNVQEKTALLVLVIIVAYQNVEVLFTLNVMEKRVKTGIILFKFPKDNTEKRRWINIISMYRRKGAGDNFSPYDESKSILFVNTTSKQTRYVLV